MSSYIIEHVSSPQNPRIERHKPTSLISGADDWETIEDFGQETMNWL
jgi:hypothetical protein